MAKQKIGSFKRNKNIEPPIKKAASIYEEVNGDDDDFETFEDDLNDIFPENTENEDE